MNDSILQTARAEEEKAEEYLRQGQLDEAARSAREAFLALEGALMKSKSTRHYRQLIALARAERSVIDRELVKSGNMDKSALEVSSKKLIELAQRVANAGKNIEAASQDLETPSRFAMDAVLQSTQAGNRPLLANQLPVAEELVNQAAVKRLTDRLAAMQFRVKLLRTYLETIDQGHQAFISGMRKVLQQVRDANWACHESLMVVKLMPEFIGQDNSLSLYSYLVAAETELSDNQSDTTCVDLYVRLGELASSNNLHEESIRWLELAMNRNPDSVTREVIKVTLGVEQELVYGRLAEMVGTEEVNSVTASRAKVPTNVGASTQPAVQAADPAQKEVSEAKVPRPKTSEGELRQNSSGIWKPLGIFLAVGLAVCAGILIMRGRKR